jgi:hypothetical protein
MIMIMVAGALLSLEGFDTNKAMLVFCGIALTIGGI